MDTELSSKDFHFLEWLIIEKSMTLELFNKLSHEQLKSYINEFDTNIWNKT